MNTNRITIASIQPPFSDTKSLLDNEKTIEAGLALLKEALTKGTAFCVLPEFFNCYGVETSQTQGISANFQEIMDRVSAMAKEYESYVILPLLVPVDGAYRNRAYIINIKGQVTGFYDKTHITVVEREQLNIIPGNEIKCHETEFGRIAVVLCYDIYFPELFSTLMRLSPQMIFFPSLQRSDHELANTAILQTRAMDTQAYIVRSSFGCPAAKPWTKDLIFGQSAVVHPDGTILANAGHYEGTAIATIDFPFVWCRNRCGGYPPAPVKDFLNEDRLTDLYTT